jgi:hypothetical protein
MRPELPSAISARFHEREPISDWFVRIMEVAIAGWRRRTYHDESIGLLDERMDLETPFNILK